MDSPKPSASPGGCCFYYEVRPSVSAKAAGPPCWLGLPANPPAVAPVDQVVVWLCHFVNLDFCLSSFFPLVSLHYHTRISPARPGMSAKCGQRSYIRLDSFGYEWQKPLKLL